nr:MAG TPA: hypothetical protein [Caudoviricetes sp.]
MQQLRCGSEIRCPFIISADRRKINNERNFYK